MRAIAFRLTIAFLCVIALLVAQGVFGLYNLHFLSRIQEQAHERQLGLKRLSAGLADIRLTVYKLLGTMNPDKMDELQAQYKSRIYALSQDLAATGLDPGLIEKNRMTYETIIDQHYDFAFKTARLLIEGESKDYHERIMRELNERGKAADQESSPGNASNPPPGYDDHCRPGRGRLADCLNLGRGPDAQPHGPD